MPIFKDGVPYLTDDEFCDQFDPWMDELNETLRQVEPEELESLKYDIHLRNIWTLVEVEENLYIVPGIHWVDRLHYVITSKPWQDDTLHTLWVDYEDFDREIDKMSLEHERLTNSF